MEVVTIILGCLVVILAPETCSSGKHAEAYAFVVVLFFLSLILILGAPKTVDTDLSINDKICIDDGHIIHLDGWHKIIKLTHGYKLRFHEWTEYIVATDTIVIGTEVPYERQTNSK